MQTSQTVTGGAVPDILRPVDHNRVAADLGELYNATAPGSLTFTDPPDLIMQYRYKADAFSIGTFDSQGYFRLASGAPWGADAIKGTPTTETPLTATTTSTSEAVVLSTAFALPPHPALTVTKVEALLRYTLSDDAGTVGYTLVCTKIGITPVAIAADGTETPLGAEVTTVSGDESFDGGPEVYLWFERAVSADFGAGYAVAADERLGVRVKFYGQVGNAAVTGRIDFPVTRPESYITAPFNHGEVCEFAFWFA